MEALSEIANLVIVLATVVFIAVVGYFLIGLIWTFLVWLVRALIYVPLGILIIATLPVLILVSLITGSSGKSEEEDGSTLETNLDYSVDFCDGDDGSCSFM